MIVPRPRLFSVLNSFGDCPCLWISGPPGCGKTSLVNVWVEQAGTRVAWYRMDSGDTDPAGFVANLWRVVREAGGQSGDVVEPPDASTLTFPATPTAEAVNPYFKTLFSGAADDLTIVLDDYHEVAEDDGFAVVLASAIREAPEHVQFVVVGRTAPRGLMVSLEIKGLLSRIGWQHLRLDEVETRSICRTHGLANHEAVQPLLRRCDGWAAPAVLLARHHRTGQALEDTESRWLAAVRDYISSLEDPELAPDLRDAIAHTALLPAFSPESVGELTGSAELPRWLRQRADNDYLTFPDSARAGRYRFHPLYRHYLAELARQRFGLVGIEAFRRRAALLLEREGDFTGAFDISLADSNWEACIRAIERFAPQLLDAGRAQEMLNHIQRIPTSVIDRHPRLNLWVGRALGQRDPVAGQVSLQAAWHGFSASEDIKGQARAAFAMAEIQCMAFGQWGELQLWLEALDALVRRNPECIPSDARFRWHAVLAAAWTIVSPTAPRITANLEQAIRYSKSPCPVPDRMIATAATSRALAILGDLRSSLDILRSLVVTDADIAAFPTAAAVLWSQTGLQEMLSGRFSLASDCLDRAVALARKSEHPGLIARALCYRTVVAHLLRDRAAATRGLRALREAAGNASSPGNAAIALFEAWHEQAFGVPSKNHIALLGAVGVWPSCGSTTFSLILNLISASLLAERDALSEASACMSTAHAVMPNTIDHPFAALWQVVTARIAHLGGNHASAMTACQEFTRLACGPDGNIAWLCFLAPPTLSEVIGLCLEKGLMATDIARHVIQRLNVIAPERKPEAWPWKLRINTFGGLRVWLDDAPLTFGRKLPRKPIAVLKVLICMGGREVPLSRLADTVWPDKTGDSATRAAITALHRLRKILQCHEAIILEAGLLSIDTTKVWVDALAFRNVSDAETARNLYRGDFLPEDADEVWSLEPRRRFRMQYERLTMKKAETET